MEISATNVRRKFADILEAIAAGTPVLITRHGKPVAQIVALTEAEKKAYALAIKNPGPETTPQAA